MGKFKNRITDQLEDARIRNYVSEYERFCLAYKIPQDPDSWECYQDRLIESIIYQSPIDTEAVYDQYRLITCELYKALYEDL